MRMVKDPDKLTQAAYSEWAEGVESVRYIRCMNHLAIPAYNDNEGPGECTACVVEAVKKGLDNLLLDLYPLTIANASMSASEQRFFADDVAAHIGNLCALLSNPKPKL